jgi:hypothetical protein
MAYKKHVDITYGVIHVYSRDPYGKVLTIHTKIHSCHKIWCPTLGYHVYNPAAFVKENTFSTQQGQNINNNHSRQ